jgi:CheY-like chemotaxis protein
MAGTDKYGMIFGKSLHWLVNGAEKSCKLMSKIGKPQKMSNIRVILIEDHDLTRVGIRTALEQRGEVAFLGEAVNAKEGLALIEEKQPDVAIVDIGLPDMDGIELTTQFKQAQAENDALKDVKILILTLQDSQEYVFASSSGEEMVFAWEMTTRAIAGSIQELPSFVTRSASKSKSKLISFLQ